MSNNSGEDLSIVLPAKNEAQNLKILLPKLTQLYPEAEVIVINDGSNDDTVTICEQNNVKVITHLRSKGNGASIKTGARNASRDTIVFMDGDGQHRPSDIPGLLEKLQDNVDMVVGARSIKSQASVGRLFANTIYNKLATWMTGHLIKDLTSGFRAVNKKKFLQFLYLLPNGFSYPTTCTMAFFRAGYSVEYVDIETETRLGDSHISLLKDGVRFFVIIFKVGTLFSPLKLFVPLAAGFFTTGLLYYLYTYISFHSFTNMSALLFMTSVLVFLIGLVSEQITTLIYKDADHS